MKDNRTSRRTPSLEVVTPSNTHTHAQTITVTSVERIRLIRRVASSEWPERKEVAFDPHTLQVPLAGDRISHPNSPETSVVQVVAFRKGLSEAGYSAAVGIHASL
jgi:hypothetical protein